MFNLGVLYAQLMDPPDLDAVRRWWERAADAGDSEAMFNLGVLYAQLMDPPDLDAARRWWEGAANAGHAGAMFNLGVLYAQLMDPPELDQRGCGGACGGVGSCGGGSEDRRMG